MSTLATIPFHGTQLVADHNDGNPLVALKPACESIGLAYSKQLQKLKAKTWATVSLKATVGADGKSREMAMIDRRTLTMWLATIEPSRVSVAIRPTLEAFQNEAADALDAYFHEGGAINPNATEDQLDRIHRQAAAQASIIRSLQGVVHADYLEAKGRLVLARALGEEPELDQTTMPVDVTSYLRERGVKGSIMAKQMGNFGKRLRSLYEAEKGFAPPKVDRIINGTFQRVNGYTRQDLHLFDRVYEIMRGKLEGLTDGLFVVNA